MSTAAADPAAAAAVTRKERRRERKKERRRRARREAAEAARKAAEALAADPEEERRLRELEDAEADASERARRAFEDAERRWLEAAAARAAEKAAAAAAAAAARGESTAPEDSSRECKDDHGNKTEEDDEWEYVEDGPAEIIWEGNEITVKKKKVKVPKKAKENQPIQQEDRPTSNPLPPLSVAFASQRTASSLSAQEVLDKVAQETPNFGTEQDKAHCPFHLKTGACRFGVRCSRVHLYPDKSCTLLMRNMYNGPGLAWEQDEGLEWPNQFSRQQWPNQLVSLDWGRPELWPAPSTDEEIEQSYEEFYEDVHTEFLKFGELVNFKVCRNGSLHLRGNVYVHYKSLDSALLAYSRMNGRYFAGKQITCEFVAVTRWKVAICGEYMRSRFKTCSRGIACNFIHCFRNPGGDYKWADWDNPPPKYWIRKMAALFGPSDDTVYGKGSNTPHFDRSQSSDRRPRSSDPRSRDGDAHKQHSSRDYSHAKQECSSPTEHSRHRRESSASDKRRSRELKDKTGKYSCRMESERESHKNMREERHRSEYGDGGRGGHGKVRSRKNRSERQESLEPRSSHWPSDFSDADTTNSLSGSQSTDRHHRKSRRQSLEDLNLERHRSTSHKSTQEHNTSPRRSSRHRYKDDDSYDEKYDGRGQYVEHRDHHDASDDRWVATNSDVDSDLENRYHRSSSKGSKLERKVDGPSDAEIGYERSTTKSHRERKRRSGNSEHSNSEEDSDTRDTSSGAWRSRSRSSDENFSTHRSRRKRSRSSHDS